MAEAVIEARILFLTRSLGFGGSERQLVELAKQLHRRGLPVSVAQFYGGGPLEHDLRDAGVPVTSLRKRGRWDVLGLQRSLLGALRQHDANILHSYLVEPNIMSGLVRPRAPRVKVVWGVRASDMGVTDYGWVPRASFAASVALSRVPDLIIANSHAGASYHARAGYPASRITVIPNGIDTLRFVPDAARRSRVRAALAIADDVLLIGNLGRPDLVKDYDTFVRAAAAFHRIRPEARFLCVGSAASAHEQEIRGLIGRLGLDSAIHWVPPRADIESLHNACDIVTSSSLSEGFPNVLAEAMACGVPCVTTDAGDSRVIVGDLGEVVPIRDPDALARGWTALDRRRSPALAADSRTRIVDAFSLEQLADRTEIALQGVLGPAR